VIAAVGDAVASRFVESLARPSGNVTRSGFSRLLKVAGMQRDALPCRLKGYHNAPHWSGAILDIPPNHG
jgi:hypothetical protein